MGPTIKLTLSAISVRQPHRLFPGLVVLGQLYTYVIYGNNSVSSHSGACPLDFRYLTYSTRTLPALIRLHVDESEDPFFFLSKRASQVECVSIFDPQ